MEKRNRLRERICPKCKKKFKIKPNPSGLHFLIVHFGSVILVSLFNWNNECFLNGYFLGIFSPLVCFYVIKLINHIKKWNSK